MSHCSPNCAKKKLRVRGRRGAFSTCILHELELHDLIHGELWMSPKAVAVPRGGGGSPFRPEKCATKTHPATFAFCD